MLKAIILAAGEGSRLRPFTAKRPKCLVELAGKPLLSYQVAALRDVGVRDIIVVTGYRADQIEALGLSTAHNPHYATTNMVTTLMCAGDQLDGKSDVLIAYADIVYETRVLETLISCSAPISTTVDRSWRDLWSLRLEDPLSDAETLKLDGRGNILELGQKPASYRDVQGQFMGLIKIRADFAPEVVRVYRELDPRGPFDGKDRDNMYMTSFLQYLIDHVQPVRAAFVDGGWLEVDTTQDLELFNRLHREGRLSQICRLETLTDRGQVP